MLNGISGWVEIAARVGGHAVDDVADEGLVLDAVGREAGRFVAAPDHHVGGLFDFFDLVAVDHLFIAGEVDGAGAGGAQLLADGKQHGVAEAAAGEQNGLARGSFGGRAGGTHEDHRLAGLEQRAEIG